MDITSKNRDNLKQAVSSETLQSLAGTPPFYSSMQMAQSPLQTEENQTLNKDKNEEPEIKYSMETIHPTVKCCTMICHMLANFLFILLEQFHCKYAVSTQVLFTSNHDFHRSVVCSISLIK